MEQSILENYLKSAEIMKQAQAVGRAEAKPGVKLLDLAEKIEAKIKELGGEPAFPVNLSRNQEAAHFTPTINSTEFIGEKDVLKVDIGVHVDGFITDTAFTLDFGGQNADLLEASEAALQAAIAKVKAGVSVREIGKAIAFEIRGRGYEPISNLSGHSLQQYVLHAGEEIPNIEQGSYVLREDDVFAIEPFATTGKGKVADSDFVQIYSIVGEKRVRLPTSRAIFEATAEAYRLLPFTPRWLSKDFEVEGASFRLALRDLEKQEVLEAYPGLVESSGGIVSQAESTVIVEKDGCKVLV